MQVSLFVCVILALCMINFADAQKGNWEISGSLTFKGGKIGAKIGIKIRFRRSEPSPAFDVALYFINTESGVAIPTNPCEFSVYDSDNDGVVTEVDLDFIFYHLGDGEHKLQVIREFFIELDSNQDNKITEEEFIENLHKVISPSSCIA